MNIETLAVIMAIMKSLPDNSFASAVAAEMAAQRAQEYGQRIYLDGDTLIIGSGGDEG